jgi:uncharacterized protein (TIGR00369 family)
MTGTALDEFPSPPCAKLLGWRFIEARPDEGWIRIGFEGKPEFLNPSGFIQGGLLTAMLDDTMGPAVVTHTKGAFYPVSIDLNVQFLGAAKPGPLFCEAKVVQLGKSIGFVEGVLTDGEGRIVARATQSVRLVPGAKALGPKG